MRKNYSKGGSYYKKKKLSQVENERIERMLVHLSKNELDPVKNYFLALLNRERSLVGTKGVANRFSKKLDLEQTPAEIKMSKILDEFKITYKTQRIVYYGNGKSFFILDFYLPADKLAIEVDGGYHDSEEQKLKDAKRSVILNEKGIRVIRFKNEEVDDIDYVKDILSNNAQVYYLNS